MVLLFIVIIMLIICVSDVVIIFLVNNLLIWFFIVLCEVRRNWSILFNVVLRIFDVGGYSIDDNYLLLGFVLIGKISVNVGMV